MLTDGFFARFRFVLHHGSKKRQFQFWNFWSRLKIAPAHCVQSLLASIIEVVQCSGPVSISAILVRNLL